MYHLISVLEKPSGIMYLLHLTETGLGKSRDLPKDSQEISDRAGVSIYLFLCKNPPSIIDSAADRVISEHSAMFIFQLEVFGGLFCLTRIW